jgi:hypothetical protein
MTAWRVSLVAVHHDSGSCSDHPGLGCEHGYSDDADARMFPASSIASVLVPDVPTSLPIVTLTA